MNDNTITELVHRAQASVDPDELYEIARRLLLLSQWDESEKAERKAGRIEREQAAQA